MARRPGTVAFPLGDATAGTALFPDITLSEIVDGRPRPFSAPARDVDAAAERDRAQRHSRRDA